MKLKRLFAGFNLVTNMAGQFSSSKIKAKSKSKRYEAN